MSTNYKKKGRKSKELNTKLILMGSSNKIIRLQPYQLVKDLRNKIESTNPSSVLNGNIDQFIEGGLKVND